MPWASQDSESVQSLRARTDDSMNVRSDRKTVRKGHSEYFYDCQVMQIGKVNFYLFLNALLPILWLRCAVYCYHYSSSNSIVQGSKNCKGTLYMTHTLAVGPSRNATK